MKSAARSKCSTVFTKGRFVSRLSSGEIIYTFPSLLELTRSCAQNTTHIPIKPEVSIKCYGTANNFHFASQAQNWHCYLHGLRKQWKVLPFPEGEKYLHYNLSLDNYGKERVQNWSLFSPNAYLGLKILRKQSSLETIWNATHSTTIITMSRILMSLEKMWLYPACISHPGGWKFHVWNQRPYISRKLPYSSFFSHWKPHWTNPGYFLEENLSDVQFLPISFSSLFQLKVQVRFRA